MPTIHKVSKEAKEVALQIVGRCNAVTLRTVDDRRLSVGAANSDEDSNYAGIDVNFELWKRSFGSLSSNVGLSPNKTPAGSQGVKQTEALLTHVSCMSEAVVTLADTFAKRHKSVDSDEETICRMVQNEVKEEVKKAKKMIGKLKRLLV